MSQREYNLVRAPFDYPGKRYTDNTCSEHILIFWLAYGVIPKDDEVVHHINGNKKDNRPENLELLSEKEHLRLHGLERGRWFALFECPTCHKIFERRYSKSHLLESNHKNRDFCSKKCSDIGNSIPYGKQEALKIFQKKSSICVTRKKFKFIESNQERINNILQYSKNLELKYENGNKDADIYIMNKTVKCCCICYKEIQNNNITGLCKNCYNIKRKEEVEEKYEISKEHLEKMIQSTPFTHIASIYKVSDNAVRKWCKSFGLPYKKKDIKEKYNL